MKTKSSGYILILVIFTISACFALLMAIVRRSFTYQRKVSFATEREKARLLSLGSIELAMDQVSLLLPKKSDDKNDYNGKKENENSSIKSKNEKSSSEKKWLKKLLPTINKWQKFEFNDEKSGVVGKINLYISCENGKLNLNSLKEELKPKEKPEDKTENEKASQKENTEQKNKRSFLDEINEKIQNKLNINFKNALKDVDKKLDRLIEDPTELFRFDQFKKFNDTTFISLELKNQKKEKKDIFLMDLFTISNSSGKINPWLMSRSLTKIFDFKLPKTIKNIDEIVDKFKPNMNWQKDWNGTLSIIYGLNFESISKNISQIFSSTFEITAFSVTSYVTVGNITQRMYALLEIDDAPNDFSPESKFFKVSKIYWF